MKRIILSLFTLALCVCSFAADRFISFDNGDILLCEKNETVKIYVDDADNSAVRIAAQNLVNDIKRVCGANAVLTNNRNEARIVVGSMGHSTGIDAFLQRNDIDPKELKGKREKYIITIINNQLVIAGSDRRGAVYGIYELSAQMGVSPWYYWMDTPVKTHDKIYALNGNYTDGEPAVRYRGIFLNDEAPCLTSWVKNTFGTDFGGHEFYAKVFELVLRLKGNYMWPAMWGWAFYADDELNSKTADDMGVMIGTSHHEPMSRSQKEWQGHTDNPNLEAQDIKSRQIAGNGKWDYSTNKAELDYFWYGGVERNKNTEDIITIGMRGDGDMAMSEERNTKLLESIVKNQRKLISKARGKAAKDVPQLWALYKEVLDYYDDGMRVPDDVTMLLCDDNWGNVRRVPSAKERQRSGGWGLYYHVDYVGAPRNSKLLNVTPIQNMWEQLTLAYDYGIDRLWILNVGDLKPMEYPIQLFMDMAWDVNRYKMLNSKQCINPLEQHTIDFCASIFGEEKAMEAARILNLLCKYNGRCTPEMLDAHTYNLAEGEWATVVDEYKTLERDALRQYAELSADERDAYFQLILFPAQLMANLHEMYYSQAMNNVLHDKGDAAQNEWADLCEKCFKRDAELMRQYNKDLAGGKWDGMMTQKHIGYKIWNDNFPHDMMPQVYRLDNVQNIFDEDGRRFVAMEAEHFNEASHPQEGVWTIISGMGRTKSAVTIMPQTADVKGASLTYKFIFNQMTREIIRPKIHVITKSTLDFQNKGGMTYSLVLDGGKAEVVNFNSNLNEAPENIYSIYYPTVAGRVVEKVVELPLGSSADGIHTLTFIPNDPGIVLEKIIIDFGGYSPQYLFGTESLRK